MAAKKTANNTDEPAAKKTAKKATAKKAAVKKTAKDATAEKVPARKAATKKTAAKKVATKTSAAPKAKKAPAHPSPDALARAAYLNYRRRVENSLPGDAHGDWLEAVKQLTEE